MNDRSRTTGRLFWDPWGEQLFGGELTTEFEPLPGKRDTVEFRRKLGVIEPHTLKLRALDADAELTFEGDIGFGPSHLGLEVTRAVRDAGKPLEISGTISTGFGLFAIEQRHKSYALLLQGSVVFDVELYGEPIQH